MTDKSHVSMGQHQCPVCGKVEDSGEILLDKRLQQSMDKHTLTGYGLCEEHQAVIDDGFVIIIEVDNEPPNGVSFNGPSEASRTGLVMYVRRELLDDIFKDLPSNEYMYMDSDTMKFLTRLKEGAD